MKHIFTTVFCKKVYLLMVICLLLITSGTIAQVTATEDFDTETTGASSFSESGINFTHTFTLQNLTGFGFGGSAKFLELVQPPANFTTTATISINNSLNPGASFKINSFAAYVSSSATGTGAFNGAVTVSGIPTGSSTSVSATINIASSGSLPPGQTRDANGVVNGLNLTGTALDGLFFTTLTFSINDADGPGAGLGTRYFELDHINFSTPAIVSTLFSINDVSLSEGNSGTKLFTFTVTRSANTAASSVQVQSANGTATAPGDYVALPLTTLNFTAGGALTQTVSVTVNGDVTIEGNETFFMNLSNPTGGTIADAQGTGTILEDDETAETFEDETVNAHVFSEAGFAFSSTGALLISRGNNVGTGSGISSALDTRVGDGGSTGNVGSFSITNPGTSFFITGIDLWTSNNDGTSGTTGAVTVTFTGTKADGSGTVNYAAPIAAISGNNFQTINFTGTPLANVQLISISVTLGAGINYISLDNFKYGTASVSATQVSINDVSVLEGTGGGTTTATFTVSRTNNTSAFTVNLASSDGTATAGLDYVAYPSTTLSFAAGGALSQTVTVTILKDASIEPNETFNMTLSGATNGTLYLKPVGIGTILDDDKVIETFEGETDNATTFSENTITFAATSRLKVHISQNSGSGSSTGYLTSGASSTGGVVGKISITSPNTAFKLLQLDAWTGTGNPTVNFASGPVTFTGTLFGGGTVTTTKTITPTSNAGTGWHQNISFTGTPLDNVLLTDLEFSAGGTLTTVEIDNINYVAISTSPIIEVTDASNVAITNGGAASVTNNTDFGAACTGSSISKTFTIKNTGGANLTLSGSPIAVLGGANAGQFSITSQPAATVAPNGNTTFTVSYAPTAAGTHNATITLTSNDATNSPYLINIKGTANAPVAIGTPPANTSTCAGTAASFTVTATGSGTLSYQWYKGTTALSNTATGSVISGVTTSTLTIGNPGPADAGTDYNVKVSSSTGCGGTVTSGNASLTVATQIVVNAPAVTQPTCTTPTGTIVVNATGSGTLEYSINNGASYQASATFTGLAPGSSNNIRVRYTATPTCFPTSYSGNPVVINVVPTSPMVNNPTTTTGTINVFFSQSFTQTGGTAPFVFAINSGTLPNGLSLANNGTLSGTPTQSGSFPITVKVTDGNGCTGTGTTYSLVIGSSSTSPSGTGAANPSTVAPGGTTLLTVTVTPGTNPASTGITVTGDLTSIGGSATQQFYNDGTHGDVTAGDNIFSFSAIVTGGTANGVKTLSVVINDAQSRSGSASISLTVNASSITDYFRTRQSGNWSDPNTWESATDAGFTAGVVSPATLAPDYTANAITILGTHIVTITANLTTDQTTINSGGALLVNPNIVLTVNDGSGTDLTVSSGGSMTIRSTAAGTGSVGNSTTATITGNVTVERFISSQNNRSYRMLAPSVNTASSLKQFIRDNWQEGTNNPNTSTINNPVPGYGIQITGSTTGANGFDATQSGQGSVFTYDQTTAGFIPIPNTNASVLDGKTGYLVYIRGDRSIDLTSTASPLPSTNTTLRATGSLLQHTQTYPNLANDGGFSLVTNPYASSVSWNSIYNHAGTSNSTLFESFYTYLDPNIGSRGGYVTVSDGGTVNPDPGTSIPHVPAATVDIQSGQAFFVQTKTGVLLPTLTIQESDKSTTNNLDVFRVAAPPTQKFTASLYYNDAEHGRRLADGVTELYDNSYNAGVDGDDAEDLSNFDENIAIARGSNLLSIEGRPLVTVAPDTLQLFMSNMKQQAYEWQFNPTNFGPALTAVLVDNYTGTRTNLDVSAPTVVPFTVTAVPASGAADRFYIVFKISTPLPVTLTSVKAYEKNSGVQVEWTTQHEISMDHYNVERSGDGRQFSNLGRVAATNTISVTNYNLFDPAPFTGSNYYRIKITDKVGQWSYSPIVKVSISNSPVNFITVYPNPLSSNAITVQLNLVKGAYTIRLTNTLGQQLLNQVIEHPGGSAAQTVTPLQMLAAGTYQVSVTGNGLSFTQQVIKY